jgi:5-dehydro-4-deoxyglucarate dehydratase
VRTDLTEAVERNSARTERATKFAAWLSDRSKAGVLAFPLTPFTSGGEVDLEVCRLHVRRQLAARPGAIFTCCGTGEFFSLSEDEYRDVVAISVQEAAGAVPVVAGTGYGWAQAARFAGIAATAGADGALVLPHYLVDAPQRGLVEHVRELAKRTDLPLIVYQRGNVKYSAVSVVDIAQLPTVVGLKDGHSDFDQLQRLRLAIPKDFLFFNGSLTAEMQARAYASIGIPTYSSSVHSFAPEIASTFFGAFHAGDTKLAELLLSSFYWPLSELRDKCPGYGVSLVKAAARLRGEPVGPVRAPLVGPSDDHFESLERIVRNGLELVGAEFRLPNGEQGRLGDRH